MLLGVLFNEAPQHDVEGIIAVPSGQLFVDIRASHGLGVAPHPHSSLSACCTTPPPVVYTSHDAWLRGGTRSSQRGIPRWGRHMQFVGKCCVLDLVGGGCLDKGQLT